MTEGILELAEEGAKLLDHFARLLDEIKAGELLYGRYFRDVENDARIEAPQKYSPVGFSKGVFPHGDKLVVIIDTRQAFGIDWKGALEMIFREIVDRGEFEDYPEVFKLFGIDGPLAC